MVQAQTISEAECCKIQELLALFHQHKDMLLEAGIQWGKGNKPIKNWHIPKLEFLQSVAVSIHNFSAPIQWSADVTEQAHISEIKLPSKSTNNQKYEAQIIWSLDRVDKCRWFDLATSLQDPADQLELAVIQTLKELADKNGDFGDDSD